MSEIITRRPADRAHIDTADETQLRHWAKHLNVSPDILLEAVGKVGNRIETVRKELGRAESGGS